MLPITSEGREELKFWTESIEEYNAHPIWHKSQFELTESICVYMYICFRAFDLVYTVHVYSVSP